MTALEERELAKSWLRELAQPLGGLLMVEVAKFLPESDPSRRQVAIRLIHRMATEAAEAPAPDFRARLVFFRSAFLFGYGLARYDASSQHIRSGVAASYGTLDASLGLIELVSEAPATLSLDEDVLFDVVVERLAAYMLGIEDVTRGLSAAAKWTIVFGYALARYELRRVT